VEGAADLPYSIPNILVDLHTPTLPVTTLWWRSVGHSHTAFVVESFIDELAHAAGADPYTFRRDLLTSEPRFRAVLERVAAMADWGRPLPEGEGRGIALMESFGSIVGEVAHVAVSPEGVLRVTQVFAAVDCGDVVNTDAATAQVEGGIIFGLSAAWLGEITIAEGRVVEGNFHDYEMIRLAQAPRISVEFIPSGADLGGLGEPGVPPIAAAVTNAIFAARGIRVRTLPIRNTSLATVATTT
jgi:isoquinoline 1-oxidoreductase beta subunit